jgi:hypothetical protein
MTCNGIEQLKERQKKKIFKKFFPNYTEANVNLKTILSL